MGYEPNHGRRQRTDGGRQGCRIELAALAGLWARAIRHWWRAASSREWPLGERQAFIHRGDCSPACEQRFEQDPLRNKPVNACGLAYKLIALTVWAAWRFDGGVNNWCGHDAELIRVCAQMPGVGLTLPGLRA